MREVVRGGEGRAVRVRSGAVLTVENIAGGQVGDLFAFSEHDPAEHLSAAHTRAENWSLFPQIDQVFVSNFRRPMLTLLRDDLESAHDMLIPACDPERYRALGAPDHRSCAQNLQDALARIEFDAVGIPQPVNLFMPVRLLPDGGLALRESPARPRDSVALRAERDLVVVVSACPQDLVPLNAGGLSDLALEVTPGT